MGYENARIGAVEEHLEEVDAVVVTVYGGVVSLGREYRLTTAWALQHRKQSVGGRRVGSFPVAIHRPVIATVTI